MAFIQKLKDKLLQFYITYLLLSTTEQKMVILCILIIIAAYSFLGYFIYILLKLSLKVYELSQQENILSIFPNLV